MRINEIAPEIDLNSSDGKIKFSPKTFTHFLNLTRYLFEHSTSTLTSSGETTDFMSYSKFTTLF